VFLDHRLPTVPTKLFTAALQAARQAVGEQGLIYLEAPRT
jgi:hypothetical protein